MRQIEDERGLLWLIGPGDPAWQRVETLWRRGYRRIVLPRNVICGGEAEEDAADLTQLPPQTALRLQRLRQCLGKVGTLF